MNTILLYSVSSKLIQSAFCLHQPFCNLNALYNDIQQQQHSIILDDYITSITWPLMIRTDVVSLLMLICDFSAVMIQTLFLIALNKADEMLFSTSMIIVCMRFKRWTYNKAEKKRILLLDYLNITYYIDITRWHFSSVDIVHRLTSRLTCVIMRMLNNNFCSKLYFLQLLRQRVLSVQSVEPLLFHTCKITNHETFGEKFANCKLLRTEQLCVQRVFCSFVTLTKVQETQIAQAILRSLPSTMTADIWTIAIAHRKRVFLLQ